MKANIACPLTTKCAGSAQIMHTVLVDIPSFPTEDSGVRIICMMGYSNVLILMLEWVLNN